MSCDEDVLCSHCGYSLFGLAQDSRCPECGTAVEWSEPGDRLAAADGEWLRHLARGQRRIVVGAILVFAVHVLFIVSAVFLKGLLSPAVFDVSLPVAKLPCHVWLLLGILELTRQDPRLSLAEPGLSLRTAVRAGAALALCLAPISGGIFHSAPGLALPFEFFRALYSFVLVLTAAGVTVYLSGLALRIPDGPLAETSKSVGVSLSVMAFLFFVGRLLLPGGPIGQAFSRSLALGLLELFSALIGLAMLCYLVRAIQLWWTYWRAFRRYAPPA